MERILVNRGERFVVEFGEGWAERRVQEEERGMAETNWKECLTETTPYVAVQVCVGVR